MKKSPLILCLLLTGAAQASRMDKLPDSPLDTSMGETEESSEGKLRQSFNDGREREEEQQREEELLENRYDVPDEKEEEEFNQNGP